MTSGALHTSGRVKLWEEANQHGLSLPSAVRERKQLELCLSGSAIAPTSKRTHPENRRQGCALVGAIPIGTRMGNVGGRRLGCQEPSGGG
jgi:hypothetical protein